MSNITYPEHGYYVLMTSNINVLNVFHGTLHEHECVQFYEGEENIPSTLHQMFHKNVLRDVPGTSWELDKNLQRTMTERPMF
jgi:hypothetical protein